MGELCLCKLMLYLTLLSSLVAADCAGTFMKVFFRGDFALLFFTWSMAFKLFDYISAEWLENSD